MPRSLQDRLQSLKQDAGPGEPPSPAGGQLERVERDLVGSVASELPLKLRLERLVAAASRPGRAQSGLFTEDPPKGLEEIVQGCRVQNERGEFFLVGDALPLETFHGDLCLSRLRSLSPESVGVVAGEPGFASFDLADAVFLDTETTGLAGGTGTAAFLIGIGYVEEDRFQVKQYFMRDYHEEAALLRGLGEELRRFSRVVTYNGKMFDLPLLEARYRLNRDTYPLAGAAHLDLLFPARRLWKARYDSCRLENLEAALLGVRRRGDVPGEQIPSAYFDYIRRRDGRAMARVFQHNRVDVLSLAALAVLACQWVTQGQADDPRDLYSLGRVLERAELYERSEAAYRRAIELGHGSLSRVSALQRLAVRSRRGGDHAAAAELWRAAADEGVDGAFRELAVHHEFRKRDLAAALGVVDEGLGRVADAGDPRSRRLRDDLAKRRRRLVAKLARREARDTSRRRQRAGSAHATATDPPRG